MNKRLVSLIGMLLVATTLPVTAGSLSAHDVAERLAGHFRAMKAYTVFFKVEGADFTATGSYAVEGDRYYMQVGDAEAYCDGAAKWEVDPSKREVIIDAVDLSSRNLLNNPTRAFDFLDDAFRSELQSSEGELYRLRLTPTDKGAVMSAITVDVTAEGVPQEVVYDLDGDTIRIIVEKIQPTADVRRFDAAAYPGYEVIDFR